MAILSVQTITTAGIVPSRSAITSTGDQYSNTEAEFIEVYNGSGSASVTVCVSAQHKCTYYQFHDISVVVGVGSTKRFGPCPVKWFNNTSDYVNITYSPSTISGIEIGVFRLP